MQHVVWSRALFAFFACCSVSLTCGSYAFFAPFFPLHASEFNIDRDRVGMIFGAFSLAQLLVSPFAGILATLFSRRVVSVVGLLLLSCSTFLSGCVPHADWACAAFIILRCGQGIGATLALTSLNAALVDAFPFSRGLVVGAAEVGSSLGWSLGPAAGGCLYTVGGFSFPFTVVASVAAASVVPLIAFWPRSHQRERDDEEEKRTAGERTRTLLSWKERCALLCAPGLMVVLCSQILLITGWCSFDLGFTAWLHQRFGFGTYEGGLYFAIAPAAYMLTAFPVGWLVDNTNFGKALLAVGFLGQACSLLFLAPPFHLGPGLVAGLMVVNGLSAPLCVVPVLPEMMKSLASEDEEKTNSMSTFVSFAQSLGSATGPLVGAFVLDHVDFGWMMFAVACFNFLLVLLLVSAHWRERKRCTSVVTSVANVKEPLLSGDEFRQALIALN
eukprot:TRINITY_DN3179_c1_g1_i1.p1 TRINITY_DN3179_c1_g1~~TRINITY_DN3179_c1_g1_i1.p1  ORF type:complete len:463 (+),score=55.92 TRINITY_DN3179_c1_g1_i1:61-1389(+)